VTGSHDITMTYNGSQNISGSSQSQQIMVARPATPTPTPPPGATGGSQTPPPTTQTTSAGVAAAAPQASAASTSTPATSSPASDAPLGAPEGTSLPATVFDKAVVPPIQALELGAVSGIAFGKAVLLTPFLIPINLLAIAWLVVAIRRGRRLSVAASS
jgi:hypothetical protein